MLERNDVVGVAVPPEHRDVNVVEVEPPPAPKQSDVVDDGTERRCLAFAMSSRNIASISGSAKTFWSPSGIWDAYRRSAKWPRGMRGCIASQIPAPSTERSGSRMPWNVTASPTMLEPGAAFGPTTGATLPSSPTTVTRSGSSWAHANAYGPPPESPTAANRSCPRWSTTVAASSAQSRMHWYRCSVESPTPGRSTLTSRRPSRSAARRAATGICRRAPGVP
jgi:hypothetical protein